MNERFILHLSSLFTFAVVVWALFAYTEIWVYHNLKLTFKIIAKLLRSDSKMPSSDPPDYIIVSGYYKGRRVVCRLSRFTPSHFLQYDLRLHIHIEPSFYLRQGSIEHGFVTEHTRLEPDNKISYQCTSATALRSYFFASRIPEYEFVNIFEELTRASEIVESQV